MALPVPNLDDKTFDQLVEEARALIPRYAPQWTDHNLHDPGITFLELFAWLAEMQIYGLDRVTDQHKRKFLKLVGVRPQPAKPAKVEVKFQISPNRDSILLRKGAQVAAKTLDTGEDIVFETDEEMWVLPVALQKIVTYDGHDFIDHTDANEHDGLFYHAFGTNPQPDHALYLGLEYHQQLPGKTAKLWVNLYEQDLPEQPAFENKNAEPLPPATLAWEYWATDHWKLLKILSDKTFTFSQTGDIVFVCPNDATFQSFDNLVGRTLDELNESLYWIRCRIVTAEYAIPPRFDSLLWNAITVTQGHSWPLGILLSGNGQPHQAFIVKELPKLYDQVIIETQDSKEEWQRWTRVEGFGDSLPNDAHYTINLSNGEIKFGNGIHGRIPAAGQNNIRVLSPEFLVAQNNMPRSDGFPYQVFKLAHTPVLSGTEVIEVKEADGQWWGWTRVDDFDASLPEDRHYMIDLIKGEIAFGDGIHGRIPPKGEKNIRAVSYRSGGGVIGNVKAGAIDTVLGEDFPNIEVTNVKTASGGREAESIDEAIIAAQKDLKKPYRAVTSEDYEKLALATPGIRVARAKALPHYHPCHPCYRIAGAVTVVVVPYVLPESNLVTPKPGKSFLRAVYRQLQPARLLTAHLFVIPPQYVQVSVKAEVKIKPKQDPQRVETEIAVSLRAFLHPVQGGPEKNGWPFGRPVMKSEIYHVIGKVPGVDCVQRLDLQIVAPTRCAEIACENVKIPPHAVVYSQAHEIRIV